MNPLLGTRPCRERLSQWHNALYSSTPGLLGTTTYHLGSCPCLECKEWMTCPPSVPYHTKATGRNLWRIQSTSTNVCSSVTSRSCGAVPPSFPCQTSTKRLFASSL